MYTTDYYFLFSYCLITLSHTNVFEGVQFEYKRTRRCTNITKQNCCSNPAIVFTEYKI